MPKPKGWSDREIKHRDKIAEALIRKEYTPEQAFAIATNQILKQRRKNNAG